MVGRDGRQIEAHTALVAARSVYLQERIREAKEAAAVLKATSSSAMLTVDLPEVDPAAFRLVLSFIYTDQIDPTASCSPGEIVQTMMNVNTLAALFKLSRLERLCLRYVMNKVSVKNVLAVLENSSRLHLGAIKEFCLNFITKDSNCNEVVMSREFEDLERPLMVEVIRRKQCPRLGSLSDLQDSGGRETSLQQDLQTFLTSEAGREFADVQLRLEDSVTPSHKAILAARSSYFEGYFRSFDPDKSGEVQILIGDVAPSQQSFQSLLRYIYYGEIQMPPEDSLYLLSAPSFYIFTNSRLQEYCKHNLERNVTVDNVIQILEAADKGQVVDMKRHALKLIARHLRKLANTPPMKNLSRELLLDITAACAEELT